MKLIITGTSGIAIPQATMSNIIKFLDLNIDEIISGGSKNSPDESGELWAKSNNIALRIFFPNTGIDPTASNTMRNREMAELADAGLVFWDGLSRGTKNIKDNLHRRKKPVYVVKTLISEEMKTTFQLDEKIF